MNILLKIRLYNYVLSHLRYRTRYRVEIKNAIIMIKRERARYKEMKAKLNRNYISFIYKNRLLTE